MKYPATLADVLLLAALLSFASTSAAAPSSAEPKNLLPNASFELAFGPAKHNWVKYNPGYGSATNWMDMVNPLTISLAASGQTPEMFPVIEETRDAPDGNRAVAISVSGEKPGHLTSPVVPMKGGQAYTLSVYARSDVPSATLRLAVWNRSMDWRLAPDALSEPVVVSKRWQRHTFTFNVASYFHRGVVDIVAKGETAGEVWVDAAQLEVGPRAAEFQTRYPVEVFLTAEKPFSGMLHLMDEPLELEVASYTQGEPSAPENLQLRVETLVEGKVVATKDIARPMKPGYRKEKLSLDFSLVGDFRARVFSAVGDEIGVSSYGYMFTVHPVIKDGFGWTQSGDEKDDFQGILYSRDGQVYELPAERTRLPLWAGEGAWNFTITDDCKIYLTVRTDKNEETGDAMRTMDGGRTWDVVNVGRPLHGVLRNGDFLHFEHKNNRMSFFRSQDEGKTWTRVEGNGLGPLPSPPQPGPITQLRNGTLLWPIGLKKPGVIHVTYAFRSTDGGRAWSQGYPICPTGEPAIIELASGRLLATVRNNLIPPQGEWQVYLDEKYEDRWRLWMNQYGMSHRPQTKEHPLSSVVKNVLLADSDDGGVTWTNVRHGSHAPGEMHGSAVELPDGRIVFMHVHRVPWLHGGERARVSRDGGNTWEKETYYLSTVQTYPEYSTNCVLPPELADGKPGMILSVMGDRPFAVRVERAGLLQAVRWRPLP